MTEKRLYDVEKVRKIIPISRANFYKACAEGTIPTVKINRRVFVPSWWIDEILSKPVDGGKGA